MAASGVPGKLAAQWSDLRFRGKAYSGDRSGVAEAICHVAAQPPVRGSYRDPPQSFFIDVRGTAPVLDAA
jgi:nucleoside-diphosphate-sugar epimerase